MDNLLEGTRKLGVNPPSTDDAGSGSSSNSADSPTVASPPHDAQSDRTSAVDSASFAHEQPSAGENLDAHRKEGSSSGSSDSDDSTANTSADPPLVGTSDIEATSAPPPAPLFLSSHPLLNSILTPQAYDSVTQQAVELGKHYLPSYDHIPTALNHRFCLAPADSFEELRESLRAGGVQDEVLKGWEALVDLSKEKTGVGEELATRQSARAWVGHWGGNDQIVMMGSGGGRAGRRAQRAAEAQEERLGAAPTRLEDYLASCEAEAAAGTLLFHGTSTTPFELIKVAGFDRAQSAGAGDLGRCKMVYFTNQARYAAAWAIMKSDPFGWRKHGGDLDSLEIGLISVAKPVAGADRSFSLDDSDATHNWMIDNREELDRTEIDGRVAALFLPVKNGKAPQELEWIEGPFPRDNIDSLVYNTIANVTKVGRIAGDDPTSIRQWGFTEKGMGWLTLLKLSFHSLVVETEKRGG